MIEIDIIKTHVTALISVFAQTEVKTCYESWLLSGNISYEGSHQYCLETYGF